MEVINIDDAYILGETGAQVDKVTGLYFKNENASDTEKAQARANIGAGGTNDNLLDNAYFVGGGSQLGDGVFPINQRGQTSYSAYTNSIDRWYAAAAMTIAADGLLCGAIVQKLSQVAPLDGKTLTFSALFADGTMLSGSAVFNSASDTHFYSNASTGEYLIYNTYFSGFEVVSTRKLAAVKLEFGTFSTLANDVRPDFGEELRKCQRYLWVYKVSANTSIGSGKTFGTSSAIDVVTPVPMRAGSVTASFDITPYIVYDGGLGLCDSGAASITHNGTGNHLRWQIGHSGTNIQGHYLVMLLAGNDTTFTFSNEL